MATYTIRPVGFIDKDNTIQGTSNGGSLWATATNTQIWTYLGDQSDSTGVQSSGSGSRSFELDLAVPTIASGEFIARVGQFVRWDGGLTGKYIGCQAYKSTESVPSGVPSVATDGRVTLTTTDLGYRYGAEIWNNYDASDLQIHVFMDGASTVGNRPRIWEVGAYVYTLARATAAPQDTTNTTSTTAIIPVDVTATIDWEASTYSWQKLRTVTAEVRVEVGGNAAGTGALISTTTKDVIFDSTGTITTSVTLPDAIPNGTYKVYARAIRHREGETYIASDQIGAWSSGATLTMSMSGPEEPVLTVTADNTNARVAISVTPIRQLVNNPSFETNTTGWGSVNTSAAVRSTAAYYVGSASFLLTTNASGVVGPYFNNGASKIAVNAGLPYTFSIYAKDVNTSVNYKAGIDWYNAAGTQIGSTSWGTSTAITTTGWTRISVTATAPANAVTAVVLCYSATTPLTGKQVYFDGALFDQSSSLQAYVDYVDYSSPYVTVERSHDGGVTWESVRGLTALGVSFGAATIRYDYEAERGEVVYYRARISAYTGGVLNTSANTPNASVTLTETTWNLKCPQAPDLNFIGITVLAKPTEEISEDLGIFRPDGRRYPVVVSGTLTGWDGEITVMTDNAADWAKVKALVEAQAVLFLESPFGWSKYIRLSQGAKTTIEGTVTTQRRSASLAYVETSSPVGTYISSQFTATADGGVATTSSFEATWDGGAASTALYDATVDGGVA